MAQTPGRGDLSVSARTRQCRSGDACLLALAVLATFTVACGNAGCNLELSGTRITSEPVAQAYYCPEPPKSPLFARVQLLIDSSGSMNGFKAAVPAIQSWMRQGVSGLVGSQIELRSYRACYFNQRLDIGQCSVDLATPQPPFIARADTNLHEAISSAVQYDLTAIVTDGVAFTGSGSGDCAGGVDAACVARTLGRVLSGYQVERDGGSGGFWLLPLVAHFDGTFFSEEPVPARDFNSAAVKDRVQKEVSHLVEIGQVRQVTGGELVYEYHGLKVLFMLLVARNPEVGRAALHALFEQMPLAGVQAIQNLGDWREGVATLPAVEIFPGTLPHPRWQEAKLASTRTPRERSFCGPVGFQWQGEEATIQVECREKKAQVLLSLPVAQEASPARCVSVHLLAPFRWSLSPQPSGGLLVDYRASCAEGGLRLLVACPARSESGKGAATEKYEWKAAPDFRKAADCLMNPDAEGCAKETANLLLRLDATRPAEQPQRAFGMVSSTRLFLDEIRDATIDSAISELHIASVPSRSQ